MSEVALFHGVRQPTPSSCLSACIASILRVPIHRTPIIRLDVGAEWLDLYNAELRERLGFELVTLDPTPVFAGYWIAVVPSLNLDAPGGHAVVMKGSALVWDPANAARYEGIDMEIVSQAMFLLPLEPGMLPRGRPR